MTCPRVSPPSDGPTPEEGCPKVTGDALNDRECPSHALCAAGAASPSARTARYTDGRNWSPAVAVPGPAGGEVRAITALIAVGGTASGIGLATAKAGESPVVYTAP